jgi:hypothetical protein
MNSFRENSCFSRGGKGDFKMLLFNKNLKSLAGTPPSMGPTIVLPGSSRSQDGQISLSSFSYSAQFNIVLLIGSNRPSGYGNVGQGLL